MRGRGSEAGGVEEGLSCDGGTWSEGKDGTHLWAVKGQLCRNLGGEHSGRGVHRPQGSEHRPAWHGDPGAGGPCWAVGQLRELGAVGSQSLAGQRKLLDFPSSYRALEMALLTLLGLLDVSCGLRNPRPLETACRKELSFHPDRVGTGDHGPAHWGGPHADPPPCCPLLSDPLTGPWEPNACWLDSTAFRLSCSLHHRALSWTRPCRQTNTGSQNDPSSVAPPEAPHQGPCPLTRPASPLLILPPDPSPAPGGPCWTAAARRLLQVRWRGRETGGVLTLGASLPVSSSAASVHSQGGAARGKGTVGSFSAQRTGKEPRGTWGSVLGRGVGGGAAQGCLCYGALALQVPAQTPIQSASGVGREGAGERRGGGTSGGTAQATQ